MTGSQHLTPTPKQQNPPTLKKQVSSKMAVGDIQGCVRLLVSKDTILPPSDEVIQRLKEKHPQQHQEAQVPPEVEDESNCFKTCSEDILKAIFSFKKGTSGGPDGFLPHYRKKFP